MIAVVVALPAIGLGVAGSVLANRNTVTPAARASPTDSIEDTTRPVAPVALPTLTPGVDSVTFEIQGANRVVELTL